MHGGFNVSPFFFSSNINANWVLYLDKIIDKTEKNVMDFLQFLLCSFAHMWEIYSALPNMFSKSKLAAGLIIVEIISQSMLVFLLLLEWRVKHQSKQNGFWDLCQAVIWIHNHKHAAKDEEKFTACYIKAITDALSKGKKIIFRLLSTTKNPFSLYLIHI